MAGQKMPVDEARKIYNVFEVIAPQCKFVGEGTNKNMVPDFELLHKDQCPLKDGHCGECEKMMGVYTQDGTIFAHEVYEVFCDTKKK